MAVGGPRDVACLVPLLSVSSLPYTLSFTQPCLPFLTVSIHLWL